MSSDELRALYQEVILDHSRAKRGYGLQESADAQSHQLNPSCGDEITLQVHLDGDVVASVTWEGQGCAISTASASLLSELVDHLPADDLEGRIAHFRDMMRSQGSVEPDGELIGDAIALQGVARYVARVKCAMLPWVALEESMASLARD